jgi:hypothetical protein
MAGRTIYVDQGDVIKVRFVNRKHYPMNSKGYFDQPLQSSMLIRLGVEDISVADHRVRLTPWLS